MADDKASTQITEIRVETKGQTTSGNNKTVTSRHTINRPVWLVNNDGFPLSEKIWERMWDYVVVTHPQGQFVAESIRDKPIKRVPYPSVPVIQSTSLISPSLIAIHEYLLKLQYNHTGMQFFDIKRFKPITKLMDIAKEMIRESLPIKCLEAVILSLYLTSPLTSLQRFTIRFKSRSKGRCYRHIVLGLHSGGVYGALGLSRRSTLMYKPFQYKSLIDLIQDFITSYKDCYHDVEYIKLSYPVPHNIYSYEYIDWKFCVIALKEVDSETSLKRTLELYTRAIRTAK